MREMFSKKLVELVKKNPHFYLLSGDHGYALFDLLRRECPKHFINAGVAEQNMVGVGAGMAKVGLYPIIYGLSAFVPVRVLEQIKIDFCYENVPGLFIGDGAGVVYSHLGTSHQSTEDIAILNALPNISILSPCDAFETEACMEWAVKQKTPVYLRMGKADIGNAHGEAVDISHLEPLPIMENDSHLYAIFATGSMVKPCMDIVRDLGLKTDLFSVPVIKPFSEVFYNKRIESRYRKVLTVEEHSVVGGLGDVISGRAARSGGLAVEKLGVNDKFSELCGTYEYLLHSHGLDRQTLESRITQWLLA